MASLIFELVFVSALFIGFYLISYVAFDVCLSDDVEFHYGKSWLKRRRKNVSRWWYKFLFFDIRKEVIRWHYVMFWVHLVSSAIAIIALDVYIICNDKDSHLLFLISEGTATLSSATILCVRWKLYAQNKVRSRKTYRK